MVDVIVDTLVDFAKLLPFLFLTYLLMEWLEQRAGARSRAFIARSGRLGPVFGGMLGVLPQCGFSAAAAGLYCGRVLTLGTLYAVFLSTSDEMLPILISERVAPLTVVKILGVKMLLGILFGIATDLLLRRRRPAEAPAQDTSPCSCGHCHGEEGGFLPVLRCALRHTGTISLYLLLTMFCLNTVIHFVGEDALASSLAGRGVLPQVVSGLIGLIPNCAASVVITELWLSGAISAGSMMSGLLVGAGVGLLVLFRANRSVMQSLLITAVLYAFGVLAGILMDVTGFSAIFFS